MSFEETTQVSEVIDSNDDIYRIGILADSISGSYGKDYFNQYFINEKGVFPNILDRLAFIGKNGLGSLEFEPDSSLSYDDNILFMLKDFKRLSMKVYSGDHSHRLARLVAKSNSGAGGAKAKAIVQYNPTDKKIYLSNINSPRRDGFVKVIIKFNNSQIPQEIKSYNNELKMEYIYYLLAKKSEVKISKSWLEVDEEQNYYFITKRFDVDDEDNRQHLLSLAGIFSHNASSFTLGYENLFRAGNMLSVSQEDKIQMFKTMIFNIIYANKDDHSRNFSFLMNSNYGWSYAPSYDLTYSTLNRHHQLTIQSKIITNIRNLAIINIAKICNIKEPLKMMSDMIDVKREMLMKLAQKYGVEDIAQMILDDTMKIDKLFKVKI